MCSFMKVSNHIDKTLSDRLRELKKKNSIWLIPKVLAVVHASSCLRELSLQSLSHSSNGGSAGKVVVTRASINRDLASDVQQV